MKKEDKRYLIGLLYLVLFLWALVKLPEIIVYGPIQGWHFWIPLGLGAMLRTFDDVYLKKEKIA